MYSISFQGLRYPDWHQILFSNMYIQKLINVLIFKKCKMLAPQYLRVTFACQKRHWEKKLSRFQIIIMIIAIFNKYLNMKWHCTWYNCRYILGIITCGLNWLKDSSMHPSLVKRIFNAYFRNVIKLKGDIVHDMLTKHFWNRYFVWLYFIIWSNHVHLFMITCFHLHHL